MGKLNIKCPSTLKTRYSHTHTQIKDACYAMESVWFGQGEQIKKNPPLVVELGECTHFLNFFLLMQSTPKSAEIGTFCFIVQNFLSYSEFFMKRKSNH